MTYLRGGGLERQRERETMVYSQINRAASKDFHIFAKSFIQSFRSELFPDLSYILGCIMVLVSFTNPLFSGGFFHYYTLDESVCHFKVVRSILSLLFHF